MSHLHLQNVKMLYLDTSAPHVCSFPSALILYFVELILQVCSCSSSHYFSCYCRKSSGDCERWESNDWTVLEGICLSQTQFMYQLNLTTQECIVSSRRLFQHTQDLQERGGSPEEQISTSLEIPYISQLNEYGQWHLLILGSCNTWKLKLWAVLRAET